jgi:UDP-3-O-[3-hydroxymyristoyl] glucosamine N-acyltransferase
MTRSFRVAELAAALGGTVTGDPDRMIAGVGTLLEAEPEDLSFIDSDKHAHELQRSRAGAVLATDGLCPPPHVAAIRVPRPALAMAEALDLLFPIVRSVVGISPLAVLGARVVVGADVGIAPCSVIGDDVSIGSGTEIHPGVTIGARAAIGDDCILHAGVHVYADTVIGSRVILHSGAVIGADGFGYLPVDGMEGDRVRHRKIQQVGRVVLEDDVEVGANSAIDRASLSETRIGRGTKIDNLVTIGHNSRVGRHCIIIGQAGLAGSTTVEDHVTIAGQAGLAGHLVIGAGAVVGAQAGVTKDVPAGAVVLGSPAIDVHRARKALALFDRLPEFRKSIAAHERRLRALETQLAPNP